MGQGMQGMLPCISREALASYWPVEKIPRLARRKMQGGWGVGGCREVRVQERKGAPLFVHSWLPPISQLGDTQQLYLRR